MENLVKILFVISVIVFCLTFFLVILEKVLIEESWNYKIGFVSYNRSVLKGKDLEGKKPMTFCLQVEDKWICEEYKLVNCKNGTCDVVLFRKYEVSERE